MEKEINRGRKKKEIDGEFAEILSKLLQEAKEKGISQDNIAQAIGVSRQSLGKWANGVTVPDILDLKKLANYFDVSADYLMGFSSLPKSDLDLIQASKITNIPEKTLLKLSQLFDIKSKFDNIDIGFHKYGAFFFFSSNTIDQSINGYIDNLLDGFNKAIVELQEDPDNGEHNPKNE